MPVSTITVAGINPALNILGATQQFNYTQELSTFQINNSFIPTSLISSSSNLEFRNSLLSGFRWTHLTNNTDTYGSLTLQSFINASSNGTNLITFNNNGVNFNSQIISNATWHGTTVGLSYGGTNASLAASSGGIVYSTASTLAISGIGTNGQVLTSQGTNAPIWTTPTTGTVVGPLSSITNHVPIFDNTTGNLIADSGIVINSIVTAISGGGAATCGIGTLNGTTGVTINSTAVNTSSIINITRNNGTSGAPLGTSLGHLSVGSIVNGTSFTVYSSNALDSFGFSWQIVNPV